MRKMKYKNVAKNTSKIKKNVKMCKNYVNNFLRIDVFTN